MVDLAIAQGSGSFRYVGSGKPSGRSVKEIVEEMAKTREASFGGSRSFRYTDTSSPYYAGTGQIKDPLSGWVGPISTKKGQQLFAKLQADLAAKAVAAKKEPTLAIAGDSVRYVSDPTRPKVVIKTPSEIKSEATSITKEVSRLGTKRTEVDRLQASMVQRGMPYTSRVIDEYNRDVSDISLRIHEYNQDAILTSFKTSAEARRARQKEFGVVTSASVFDRFGKPRDTIPLSQKFGLEAAEATILGKKYKTEATERVFSGEIVGLPGKVALQKATVERIEAKFPFASTGVAGFLGPTKGERVSLPIIKTGLMPFERPSRSQVKLFAERGDIFGASVATAGLIGRKGVEMVVPPSQEEFGGIALFPKEATPVISAARGMFGLPTIDEGQYTLFGGTRVELIEKGGLAGTTLFEFALFDVGGRAAVKGLKKIKPPKRTVIKDAEIFLSLPAVETAPYTLTLRTKGVTRFENLKRILTGKQKIKPIDLSLTGEKAAEWMRPT